MERSEGKPERLACLCLDEPLNRAFMACKALAELTDWHDHCIASCRRLSLDELGFLVAHVSGLSATGKIACGERAVAKIADEFAVYFSGHDHRGSSEVRTRQLGVEKTRCEEAPRQSMWTLGCGLWSLRVPKESTATASSRTLKLMAIGGKLIRRSMTGAEDAEPLIAAFAQGVVLGFYRLAQSDIPSELEGVGFWRHCELAIVHQAGVAGGRRIRAQDDRNPNR
ncbi:hypothetical protein J2X67_003903 [Variovorax sp. 3319]|uniref:hypothetical protein n=1 Tax=Variovorax sp. 3319 TaxID=2817754 RepID=UPI002862C02B|nr:hypothetical protein [Variovorax sp. 3319]MDR6889368.1 hypothetical protein [Variovorax sp. 3319]